jgi:hypothetical protein
MFLYKNVQETSNVKYFFLLLTSLKDIVKSGLQRFLPADQNTHECFYKVQAAMLFVCVLVVTKQQ